MVSSLLNNYPEFAAKAKFYASQFQPCVILDSCHILPPLNKGSYKLIIGFGGDQIINPKENKLETLYNTWLVNQTWIFGGFGI